ncbi:hypothetical protein KEM52_005755 [Ascosphaera acerosa]|nr:hypothetical protein KEM52_005755 [Ascosphaera acerosa]
MAEDALAAELEQLALEVAGYAAPAFPDAYLPIAVPATAAETAAAAAPPAPAGPPAHAQPTAGVMR